MTASEIVRRLAEERRVERLIENISHRSLNDSLKDLSQMVYVILLEYDEDKLTDLWENGEINFFLCRIIVNQYRSVNSPYHYIFRKYQERNLSIGVGADINERNIETRNRQITDDTE